MSSAFSKTIFPKTPLSSTTKSVIESSFIAVDTPSSSSRREIITPILTESCHLLVNKTSYSGREAILAHFDQTWETMTKNTKHEITQVWSDGDNDVMVWGNVWLQMKGDEEFDCPFAMRFVIEDGRIGRIETVVDTGEMVKMHMSMLKDGEQK